MKNCFLLSEISFTTTNHYWLNKDEDKKRERKETPEIPDPHSPEPNAPTPEYFPDDPSHPNPPHTPPSNPPIRLSDKKRSALNFLRPPKVLMISHLN